MTTSITSSKSPGQGRALKRAMIRAAIESLEQAMTHVGELGRFRTRKILTTAVLTKAVTAAVYDAVTTHAQKTHLGPRFTIVDSGGERVNLVILTPALLDHLKAPDIKNFLDAEYLAAWSADMLHNQRVELAQPQDAQRVYEQVSMAQGFKLKGRKLKFSQPMRQRNGMYELWVIDGEKGRLTGYKYQDYWSISLDEEFVFRLVDAT